MTQPPGSSGSSPSSSGDLEVRHEHPDVTGGWLRPAVFGAMDGLVSNVALIAGVAGGGAGRTTVVLAGLAGLAAGAFSMAAGEYTSVASQGEAARAEIDKERAEIRVNPDAEVRELAEVYVRRGVEPALALTVAQQLSRDPDQALEVHVREELGLDPGDLPSPALAAGSSFAAFAVGALVPVLPFLVGGSAPAAGLPAALALTLLALFGCGALVARVTVRPWWYSGARQALLGAGAAALTFGIGSVVGTSLG